MPQEEKARSGRRLLWPAAGVLVSLAIAGGVWRARRVASPPATCVAGPATVAREVLGVGLLETAREVPAAFEASGRVATLLVDEGATVKTGELLGSLDPATPQRKLSVSAATLSLAKASVSRAEADLEKARVAKVSAARELKRIDQLLSGGASTPAQHDQADDRLALAEVDFRAAGTALMQSRESANVARAGLVLQQQALSDTRLVSPMDAVVVKRHREPGHFVVAGAPVLTLASTAKLWVRAWVDETALAAIQPGQPARIEFRSQPGREYAGRVDRIAKQADRQVHEVLVDVEVLELPASYAFGERADVHIATSSVAGRLARAGAAP